MEGLCQADNGNLPFRLISDGGEEHTVRVLLETMQHLQTFFRCNLNLSVTAVLIVLCFEKQELFRNVFDGTHFNPMTNRLT